MRNSCRSASQTAVFMILSIFLVAAGAYGTPVITQQPQSQTVCTGADATFTVYATGTGLSYQWRKNGLDIDGEENHTLVLTAVTIDDEAVYDVVVEDAQEAVTSDPATLSVDTGPTISVQPAGQDVCEGATVILSVTAATQVGDLSYAWYKNSQLIGGAVGASLILVDVTTAAAGSYHVVVTSDCGFLASDAAVLTVNDGPVITDDPDDQTVCVGDEITLSVTVGSQVGDLTYEWYQDDELIDGAEESSLTIASAAAADSGEYYAIVTNDCGWTSSASAIVLVSAGPGIVTQPAGATLCAGEDHTLSVEVENAGSVCQDVIGGTSSSYSAARLRGNYFRATKTIALTRIEQYLKIVTSSEIVYFVYEAAAEEGPYALVLEDHVTNSGTGTKYFGSNPLNYVLQEGKYYMIGAGWSAAHTYYWSSTHGAESFGVSLKGYSYSWVTPLPDPLIGSSSTMAYMQRITTSDLAVTYQWLKDDEAIDGAYGEEYTIQDMSADDAGEYTAMITNDCGVTYSNTAVVSLHPGVTITQQPVSLFICTGGEATFEVIAGGGGEPLTYQWRKDGVDIDGAVSSVYQIAAVEPDDAGYYSVVIDNGCTATSNAAHLSIIENAPVLTQSPQSIAGCQGQTATFTVVAAGEAGQYEYQWYKDDTAIEGATAAVYEIAAIEPEDAGDYYAEVTNLCGAAASEAASLSVDEPLAIVVHPLPPYPNELCVGDDWVFSVDSDGTNVAYQWRKDGVDIDGAVEDTYTIYDADPIDAGVYDVVISNNCGEAISNGAEIGIVSTAAFLTHPEDQRLRVGDRLELSVELDLESLAPDIDDIAGTNIALPPGGYKLRGNSYAVDQTTILTKIEQYLEVTTSGALVFFVYESTAGPNGPYALLLQDDAAQSGTGARYYASNAIEVPLVAGRHYIIGAGWVRVNVYHRVSAAHPVATAFGHTVAGYAEPYTGSLPYSPTAAQSNVWRQRLSTITVAGVCQWRQDGVDIPGADDEIYVVESATADDAGVYDVIVSNVCGEAISDAAEVSIPAANRLLRGSEQSLGLESLTP